ncbi:MAG: hypothetical protein IK085_09870, partial [Clostridia bacterium]|nr:hypothetical protein [Clostridia bacterium]
ANLISLIVNDLSQTTGLSGGDGDLAEKANLVSLIVNDLIQTTGLSGGDGDLAEKANLVSLIVNNLSQTTGLSGGDGDLAEKANLVSLIVNDLSQTTGLSGGDDDFASGAGISTLIINEYDYEITISDYDDLLAFAESVNNGETFLNAVLTADIDATGSPWIPIGNDVYNYTGIFDGNGHTITGLTFDNSQTDYAGLFGYVKGVSDGDELIGGIVRNVGLEGGSVTGNKYVGGVVGYNDGGAVTNCYNTSAVSGKDNTGGIAGFNNGIVMNCYNTGAVSCDNNIAVGGYDGTVHNDYNTGAVSGNTGTGGVVGTNNGSVINCYNTGAVSNDNSNAVGSVVGYDDGGTVQNGYNTGTVSGNTGTGGVVGINNGTVTSSYYDKDKCSCAGAINGADNDADNVKGLTTEQMTGISAISPENMNYIFDEGEVNPWLVKENDFDYMYYPHLTGFNTDNQGSQLPASEISAGNWPPKAEIIVTATASISANEVIRGDKLTWTVITPRDVVWLRFNGIDGSGNNYTAYYKYSNYNKGTTEVTVTDSVTTREWVIPMIFNYPGTQPVDNQVWSIDYKVKGSDEWIGMPNPETEQAYSFIIKVGKDAEALAPDPEPYAKYSLIDASYIDTEENGAQYRYFTVVTTDDVSKIRISYVNESTGKTKTATYQPTSTNVTSVEAEDGFSTWTIRMKITTPAQNDAYTVQCRGLSWGEGMVAHP